MDYAEFIEGWKHGRLRVSIDRNIVMKINDTGRVFDKKYRYARLAQYIYAFLGHMWTFLLLLGVGLSIWVNVWIGIISIIFTLVLLPGAISKIATRLLMKEAFQNEEFYDHLLKSGVISIVKIEQET